MPEVPGDLPVILSNCEELGKEEEGISVLLGSLPHASHSTHSWGCTPSLDSCANICLGLAGHRSLVLHNHNYWTSEGASCEVSRPGPWKIFNRKTIVKRTCDARETKTKVKQVRIKGGAAWSSNGHREVSPGGVPWTKSEASSVLCSAWGLSLGNADSS